jgi:hypothetical protein
VAALIRQDALPGRKPRCAQTLYPMYTGTPASYSQETLEECGRGHATAAARSTAGPNRRCSHLKRVLIGKMARVFTQAYKA